MPIVVARVRIGTIVPDRGVGLAPSWPSLLRTAGEMSGRRFWLTAPMRLATARTFALSLPETTEEPHFEASSFRVKGKIFATVPPANTMLHIPVGADEVLALVEEDPEVYERIQWGQRLVDDWVRVHLARADRVQVCELLEDAWRARAPKRVLAAYDAAR